MTNLPKQPDADPPTPAVLYAAKSTKDPHGSIPRQLADARALAERDAREIIGEFSDEDKSAWKGNRGDGLAAAKAACAAAARERGSCVLIVQHTDRLARGDGKRADHLVQLALWARGADIEIDAVQDPETCRGGLAFAAMMGDRNEADSARKSAAVSSGLRGAARRGEWVGGILADGYRVIRNTDGPRVTRTIEFDPDRKEIYDLIWDLARRGHSARAIVVELDRRGYRTNPRKRDHRSRPFDANRVRQTLDNPFYAALSFIRGEFMGAGSWPAYVSQEDFDRLRAERRARSNADRRGPGRPPEGYVLAGLAVCGVCSSPMHAQTGHHRRQDGTYARRYVCARHLNRPGDCAATPIDAALVDPAMIDNLAEVLGDVDALRAALGAARGADRTRLEGEARDADAEIKDANRAVEKMAARVATLYGAGEDATAAALEEALTQARTQRRAAETRLDAALDAIKQEASEEDADDDDAFWGRLREEVMTRIDGARGDVKRLNLALTDLLDTVFLQETEAGVRICPTLSGAAAGRIRDLRGTTTALDDPPLAPRGFGEWMHVIDVDADAPGGNPRTACDTRGARGP